MKRSRLVFVCNKIQTQNKANNRLKGQSISTNLLRTGRILGRLEQKKGTRMLRVVVGCIDYI